MARELVPLFFREATHVCSWSANGPKELGIAVGEKLVTAIGTFDPSNLFERRYFSNLYRTLASQEEDKYGVLFLRSYNQLSWNRRCRMPFSDETSPNEYWLTVVAKIAYKETRTMERVIPFVYLHSFVHVRKIM
jgi:hypothetical protein